MSINMGLSDAQREAMAKAVTAVLADTYALYFKTHVYHWNITGPRFHDLHILFETQYNELWMATDVIAERIRALDVAAPRSYAEMTEAAAIKSGGTSDHPSAFWDFLPTVCELTGEAIPDGIQGISFAPTLTGKGDQGKHDYLYWEFHGQGIRRAIQQGDWKLVQYNLSSPDKTTIELYDLGKDIGEANDLSKENPEKTAELLKLIDGARKPSGNFPVPSLDAL